MCTVEPYPPAVHRRAGYRQRHHQIPNTRTLALCLAGLFAAGCGAGGGASGDAGAGVSHFVAEPDLLIGELDGDEAYMFGGIGGLAMDERGRILVVDVQAHEVRVFAPDGGHLFSFGRMGSGPGELRSPSCTAFGPDGRFWVRDNLNSRYNAYRLDDATAVHVATVSMVHSSGILGVPLTFDADGRLVDIGTRATPDGARRVRHHLDADGGVASELTLPRPEPGEVPETSIDGRTADGQRIRVLLQQPFGPRHLIAHGPRGEWADAIGSTYQVRWHAWRGCGCARPTVKPQSTAV